MYTCIYKHTNIYALYQRYAYVFYFLTALDGTSRAPLAAHPTLETTDIHCSPIVIVGIE
jgi:hypothetical protein